MTAPTAEQRERLRKAWGFCDNLHGWDAPCAQCQSLAQALAAEYARGRNAGLEDAVKAVPSALAHESVPGTLSVRFTANRVESVQRAIRAIAAQDEKEGACLAS